MLFARGGASLLSLSKNLPEGIHFVYWGNSRKTVEPRLLFGGVEAVGLMKTSWSRLFCLLGQLKTQTNSGAPYVVEGAGVRLASGKLPEAGCFVHLGNSRQVLEPRLLLKGGSKLAWAWAFFP